MGNNQIQEEVLQLLEKEFILKGLNCASCANKIEKRIAKLPNVKEIHLDFVNNTLKLKLSAGNLEEVTKKAKKIIKDLEPDVEVTEKDSEANVKRTLLLEGLGCASCAQKIEEKVAGLNEVRGANLNFAAKKLIISIEDKTKAEKIIDQTRGIINKLEPEVQVKKGLEIEDNELEAEIDDRELKSAVINLAVGSIFFIAALILQLSFWVELSLFGIAYLIIGRNIVWKAIRDVSRGEFFDENFLMTVATMGAFAIQEFPEAVAVMFFYKVGEIFQDLAVNRSRRSIAKLMDIKAEYANLKTKDGMQRVSPAEIEVGNKILIKPGEKVPLDGEVIKGESQVDTSALTGESAPRYIEPGQEILSGFINKTGVLTVQVTKELQESAVAKILNLVENASAKKAPTEKFITKFARYYTPVVVFSALALAFIPPLVVPQALFSDWIYRALIFLVISCPCALMVSIPLGFFGGIGSASRRGILVKGGNYLEALNQVQTIVFDKTGTLTKGTFAVKEVVPAKGYTEEEVLTLAVKAEMHSSHPIAKSILAAYAGKIEAKNVDNVTDYQEIAGQGIKIKIDDKEILAGNDKLLRRENIEYEDCEKEGTIIYISVDNEYVGYILITDQIKPGAKSAIRKLKELGIKETIMLTGDGERVAKKVANKLQLNDYRAELLPDEKVEQVEEFLNKNDKIKLAFVGDGINDAPVLARADVGVAMGALGSDAAIEAADVVLMTDELEKLGEALSIAKSTKRIIWQNIILALGVKGAVLILGMLGMASMWGAVFADVGVALLAVLNSMRIIKKKI